MMRLKLPKSLGLDLVKLFFLGKNQINLKKYMHLLGLISLFLLVCQIECSF